MKFLLCVISTLVLAAAIVTLIVKRVDFQQDCGGRLIRAANANTTDIAKVELKHAITYLESKNLTSGYTSVWYKTPDEDIGYFYNNLKAAHQELEELSADATPLEKSNLLMKLRESLITSGSAGDALECPEGLSRYPHNMHFGAIIIISFLCTTIFGLAYAYEQ